MKLIYHSGEAITHGAYWNARTGELVHCDAGTDVLPGHSMTYLKVHPAVLLLLAPLLGLVFIVSLPCIGFVVIVHTITSKVLGFLGTHLAGEAGFRWHPSEAYLGGKRSERKRD